jgi:putative transposase
LSELCPELTPSADIRKTARPHDGRSGSLGALIHAAVRRAIEVAVEEELTAALGAARYARDVGRGGYRNGHRSRTVTGPTGPLAVTLPRATLFTAMDAREWTSALVPRYQRRLREVNEAVVATYLAASNTRRLRGALAPLLNAAPLSKSAISRIVGTLKAELEAWRIPSLADVDVFGLYLDAIALRVRSAGKVTSVPVLGVVAILTDGQKQLVTLELCGGESFEAWKGCLDDLVARGLGAPVVCMIDGHPGLRKGIELVWPKARVQRRAVHKLRNLERKAPKHALAEIRADFHRIVYAETVAGAKTAYAAFARKWAARCPGVVRSLHEGGEELFTFFEFPKAQWKTLRTTNVIERLHEEFRRRVKTQRSLPTEDAALVLLFGLIVGGQIRLRRLDGWRQIPALLREHLRPAA